jgi:hypothetical protein
VRSFLTRNTGGDGLLGVRGREEASGWRTGVWGEEVERR